MPNSIAFTRRGLVTAAAGVAGGMAAMPLLSACGSAASGKGGVTTSKGLNAILPDYVPVNDPRVRARVCSRSASLAVTGSPHEAG
jgi:hypothetical protein